MNTAAAAGSAAGSATPSGVRRLPTTLLTLVRREFWENRSLWLAPLAVAALLALAALFGHYHFDFPAASDLPGGVFTPEQKVAMFSIVQWGLSLPLYLVMLCCVTYYLTECLYGERKDRSILFFKSLPVSDGLTVLAKVLVALVAVPFGVFALALAAHLVFSAIVAARVALGTAPAVLRWSTLEWLRTEAAMLATLTLAVLWYAPVAGYLLLVSAWARRSPLLWSSLPLLLTPPLERIAFGTHYVSGFILSRGFGIWQTLALGHGHFLGHFSELRPVGSLLGSLRWGAAFGDPGLWLGVIAAAAMVCGAARIRRYRDES